MWVPKAGDAVTYEEYRLFIQENYRPLHSHLYQFSRAFLCPELVQALGSPSSSALSELCQVPHPQIYTFPMLRPEICDALIDEVEAFQRWCDENDLNKLRPNSMNNYGVILDSFGFDHCLQTLMGEVVTPFARQCFSDVGGGSLDRHHGFTVEYGVHKDLELGFHMDASDVTLNVCLGRDFCGGELYFRGIRCELCSQTSARPEEEFEISQVMGRAILHRGKHRHGARPVTAGERHNLILWCNSSQYAQSFRGEACPSWCESRM